MDPENESRESADHYMAPAHPVNCASCDRSAEAVLRLSSQKRAQPVLDISVPHDLSVNAGEIVDVMQTDLPSSGP